jgi:hypothetical protein
MHSHPHTAIHDLVDKLMDIITHVYDDFWLWVAIAALEWERHDYANKNAVLRCVAYYFWH